MLIFFFGLRNHGIKQLAIHLNRPGSMPQSLLCVDSDRPCQVFGLALWEYQSDRNLELGHRYQRHLAHRTRSNMLEVFSQRITKQACEVICLSLKANFQLTCRALQA